MQTQIFWDHSFNQLTLLLAQQTVQHSKHPIVARAWATNISQKSPDAADYAAQILPSRLDYKNITLAKCQQ